MSELGTPVDGRAARRERNINIVLDVVLEMFGEEAMFPTIEQASKRSGLSLRSLYRYFADPAELLEAAIKRSREHGLAAGQLPTIGEGPLEQRIEEFVAMRLRLYDVAGPVYRATVAHAARQPRIREELTQTRNRYREQFETQFAPELEQRSKADRTNVTAAGDLLTQLDSIDFLRRHQGLSAAKTRAVLSSSLQALFR